MATCVPFDPDYGCCDEWTSLSTALKNRATELAWATLKTLSGGRVGNCPVIVRPCLGSPCSVCTQWWDGHRHWVQAGLVDGDWINCVCGTPRCSCEPLCEIVMPGPIAALVEVNLGGDEIALTNFRVDNGHRIVRTDGECWPSCQNLAAALGAPDTLGITYIPGIIPDGAGLWAAGVLACEFSKACTGAKCRLPASVTTVARQGVTFTMAQGMFADNLTGIREVDAYVLSVNPHGHRTPPTVWSPDVAWVKHRYETPLPEVTE